MRYICNKLGVDYFSITNDCDLNRVQKLYNSKLYDATNILSALYSKNFEEDFENLVKNNSNFLQRYDKSLTNAEILYEQLKNARKFYCGIGTKKVKLMLNKLSSCSQSALIVRLALEIEDSNIQAKNTKKEIARYKYYEKVT